MGARPQVRKHSRDNAQVGATRFLVGSNPSSLGGEARFALCSGSLDGESAQFGAGDRRARISLNSGDGTTNSKCDHGPLPLARHCSTPGPARLASLLGSRGIACLRGVLAHEAWVHAPGNEQLAVGPDRLFHRGVQYLEGEAADPLADTGLPVIWGRAGVSGAFEGFRRVEVQNVGVARGHSGWVAQEWML